MTIDKFLVFGFSPKPEEVVLEILEREIKVNGDSLKRFLMEVFFKIFFLRFIEFFHRLQRDHRDRPLAN